MKKHAVITGDIVNSRHIEKKELLVATLQTIFNEIENVFTFQNKFEIFRGDSFQSLLKDPKHALRVAILVRIGLQKESPIGNMWDARIGIGIGEVNYIKDNIKISNGEAFELSGNSLDMMKKSEQRIQIQFYENQYNETFKTLNMLADAIVNRWSKNACVVIYRRLLFGEKQAETAQILNISQSAVQQRFTNANFDAIQTYINYFETNF
jgi:hypothetical protein